MKLPIVVTLFFALAASLAHANELSVASDAKQLMLLDDTTGTILLERNSEDVMYPSSMSKLMTLYVLFEDLKNGSLKLDDTFSVSEKAWRKGGSKMFVRVDTRVKIEDLIRGIIIQSGNDACIVVAEGISGSEEAFAKRMTETAQKIGLKQSHFVNSTGWPDEKHVMSAADLALLSQHLVHDFPDYYPYFKEAEFTYSGITQPNRNLLINRDIGVDGLKTGHTDIAGYGITLSAEQDGRRLILVVNGLGSEKARANEGEVLLRHGFSHYQAHTLLESGEVLAALPVWLGAQSDVKVTSADASRISLPRNNKDITFMLSYDGPVVAPIEQGAVIAQLKVLEGEKILKTIPLVAAESVAKASIFARIPKAAAYLLGL